MEITVSEFRKNIKDYFNQALNGEVVCIERGGIHYNLTARLPGSVGKVTQVPIEKETNAVKAGELLIDKKPQAKLYPELQKQVCLHDKPYGKCFESVCLTKYRMAR